MGAGDESSFLLQERLEPLLRQLRDELNKTGLALALHAEPYHDDVRKIGLWYHNLPVHWLMVAHCLFCASLFHGEPFRRFWLLSFCTSFLAGFGGGTITSMIFLKEYPSWLIDDWIVIIFAVCWWLVNYCPGDVVFRICGMRPIKAACRAASVILKSRTIFSKADGAVLIFGRHAVIAPIFIATLGGTGGRLLCDLAGRAFSLPTPVELAQPSWSLRSAFGAALLYTSTVHWLTLVPRDVAQAIIITLMVGQGIASEMTGFDMDLTAPFATLFHFVTRIPEPPPRNQVVTPGSSAAASRSKGTSKKRHAHVE